MSVVYSVRTRPVTALTLGALSVYCFWMGYVLDNYTVNLPPERRVGYIGPETFLTLRGWAFAYAIVGALSLARLLLMGNRNWLIEFVLHIATIAPLVAWAVGFDLGSATTGKPAYTLVAGIAVSLPFITTLIDRGLAARIQPVLHDSRPNPPLAQASLVTVPRG